MTNKIEKECDLTNQWQSLSTLLGNDYDNSKQFKIHSNVNETGFVCFAETNTLTVGNKIGFSDEILNKKGVNLYLKVSEGLLGEYKNAVVITEVA